MGQEQLNQYLYVDVAVGKRQETKKLVTNRGLHPIANPSETILADETGPLRINTVVFEIYGPPEKLAGLLDELEQRGVSSHGFISPDPIPDFFTNGDKI